MRGKKEGSRFWPKIFLFIIFYISLSLAFYFDVINSYMVTGALLLVLIITLIVLFRYRNEKSRANKITWICAIAALLLYFDTFLLQYESYTYEAVFFVEPVEAAENSGINVIGVGTWNMKFKEDKEQIFAYFENGDEGLIALNNVDNKERYHSRNNTLLQSLGFRNDTDSEMAKNVEEYLGGITDSVERYLKREDTEGNSTGLALVLTGLIEQGNLKNGLELGITGAIDGTGKVEGIGMVKEKLMIAEEKEYRFIIIPNDNADEADEVKKAQNLDIEIFAVSHIDEAVELINRLNEEQGE